MASVPVKKKTTNNNKKAEGLAIKKTAGKVRRQRQDRAGIHISVTRCERIAKASWKGRVSDWRVRDFFVISFFFHFIQVSEDAQVVLATALQWIAERLFSDAARAANADGPKTRIHKGHFQSALVRNSWLGQAGIIKGHVLGSAAISRMIKAQGDEEGEGDEE